MRSTSRRLISHQCPLIREWLARKLECPPLDCVTLALFEGITIKAVCGYRNYDGIGVEVLIAGEGTWATSDVIASFFADPFDQLKVRRLWALVDASNKTCQRFMHKLGFGREGVLRDAADDGDRYLYALLRTEYGQEKHATSAAAAEAD